MAPWPELENAQPNPGKFIEGASGPQSSIPAKDKEASKSRCRSPTGDKPSLRTHGNLASISHGLCYLFPANDNGTPVAKTELLPSYSALVLIEEHPEGTDPWDLPELQDTGIKWSGKRMSSIQQRPEKGPSLSIAFPFVCLLYQGSEAE
jgi:sodium-dependent phosphate cotransporter